jgi:hypothetical protein
MLGQPLGDDARPGVAAMAQRERRVVRRCRPYATFAIPPRQPDHVDAPEDLTHWVTGSVRWDATDDG